MRISKQKLFDNVDKINQTISPPNHQESLAWEKHVARINSVLDLDGSTVIEWSGPTSEWVVKCSARFYWPDEDGFVITINREDRIQFGASLMELREFARLIHERAMLDMRSAVQAIKKTREGAK